MSAATQPPPWPSLYDPGLEILHIAHRNPTQPGGAYLYHPGDIFRFTLYWTLCFHTPIFLLCGTYAFWNFNFPPRPRFRSQGISYNRDRSNPRAHAFPDFSYPPPPAHRQGKEIDRRSRLVFAVLVFLVFVVVGVAGAVVGSAILGFTVYGLYQSGSFVMSTWVPFLLAVMQVLVGLLSIWPSIIDIV